LGEIILMNRLLIATILTAAPAFCASGIGVATASGHFTVERSRVYGNSTLFAGAVVETGNASSQLTLNNGAKLQLGAESRARVFENKLVLERGTSQGAAPKGFEIEARGLRIAGESPESRVWVTFADTKLVQVAALTGSVRVTDHAGTLMASLLPGAAMKFNPQAPGTAQTYSGCLVYKENRFLVQDEATGDVIEVQGAGLQPQVGNRVKVEGTVASKEPVVKLAKVLFDVTSVTQVASGGCLTVASNLNAQTTAPANAGSTASGSTAPKPSVEHVGMSTGAKVGIAVAVIGGGAGAALAAAGGKKSTSP